MPRKSKRKPRAKSKPAPKSGSRPKPIRHKSIKEVRKDRLKSFFDRRMIFALRHEVREHILAVLNERVASTVEIGDEIELDVTAFYKQVQILEELGLIEEVCTRPARGGTEHFFQATPAAYFSDEDWKDLPASVKADIDFAFIRGFVTEALEAIEHGTFHARDDKHTTWMPFVLDLRGWKEVVRLLRSTLRKLMAIQKRSALRLLMSGEPGIPVTVGIFGFETSPEYVRPGRPPFTGPLPPPASVSEPARHPASARSAGR
ncbi:MAG TPA: winged helix-turn-helix domain-containing protein [Solirubrobacterales bacterium]